MHQPADQNDGVLYRVTCPDHTVNPTTALADTEAALDAVETAAGGAGCRYRHIVEKWDPDLRMWYPCAQWLAKQILAVQELGTEVDTLGGGTLMVASRVWPLGDADEVCAQARAEHRRGTTFTDFEAMLGDPEQVTLSADGRPTQPGWCRCRPRPAGERWVRYERWSARGREAHGYVCPTCRRLTQTG
jgi:hypothetical protein